MSVSTSNLNPKDGRFIGNLLFTWKKDDFNKFEKEFILYIPLVYFYYERNQRSGYLEEFWGRWIINTETCWNLRVYEGARNRFSSHDRFEVVQFLDVLLCDQGLSTKLIQIPKLSESWEEDASSWLNSGGYNTLQEMFALEEEDS